MNITTNWREYHGDYKELIGDGFIANFVDPLYFINKCPTEAFVGVARAGGKKYVPSIARVWDTSSLDGGENGHGVYIQFFERDGKLLGGQEAGGRHQWPAESVTLEERIKLIKITSDIIITRPELLLPIHEIVVRL